MCANKHIIYLGVALFLERFLLVQAVAAEIEQELDAQVAADIEAVEAHGPEIEQANPPVHDPAPLAHADPVPSASANVEGVAATTDIDGTICCICQHPLRPATGPHEQLEATECGHVHHQTCLQRWWSFGHVSGTCPYKCPLRARLPHGEDERIEEELAEEAEAAIPAAVPMIL